MTTIAFDIDGTIFDCGDIVADAFNEGARRFGQIHGLTLRMASRDEIMSVVGIPTDEIFTLLYPEVAAKKQPELLQTCQQALSAMVRQGRGLLFDDVKSIIHSLHADSYRFFAASNGTREYISAILETYGLMHYFINPLIVIGGPIRSKSDIIRHYIEHIMDGDRVIMVGDRLSDLNAALDNDIPFIGCAFGHMGASEIENQPWIAHHFTDIPVLVRKIEEGVWG
jgi:phosphoglycolate phosphatase-like HAD superfamily hydrolase